MFIIHLTTETELYWLTDVIQWLVVQAVVFLQFKRKFRYIAVTTLTDYQNLDSVTDLIHRWHTTYRIDEF
jgi:hypothetical protein